MVLPRIYYVNNQLYCLSEAKLKDQEGKSELQIILSYNKLEKALASYKKVADRNLLQGDEVQQIRHYF